MQRRTILRQPVPASVGGFAFVLPAIPASCRNGVAEPTSTMSSPSTRDEETTSTSPPSEASTEDRSSDGYPGSGEPVFLDDARALERAVTLIDGQRAVRVQHTGCVLYGGGEMTSYAVAAGDGSTLFLDTLDGGDADYRGGGQPFTLDTSGDEPCLIADTGQSRCLSLGSDVVALRARARNQSGSDGRSGRRGRLPAGSHLVRWFHPCHICPSGTARCPRAGLRRCRRAVRHRRQLRSAHQKETT